MRTFLLSVVGIALAGCSGEPDDISAEARRTAQVASRIIEVHPPNNPTVVCFVLHDPHAANDSISCVKK